MHEKDEFMVFYLFIALLKMYRQPILSYKGMQGACQIMKFYQKLKIESIDKLWDLYFYSIQVRSNTPKSFETLIEKLKANSNNPNRILALEEIDEIGHFEEYDTLPMYIQELQEIRNPVARKRSDVKIPLAFSTAYAGKCSEEDKPFLKIATCMLQDPIRLGTNITKITILDLRTPSDPPYLPPSHS